MLITQQEYDEMKARIAELEAALDEERKRRGALQFNHDPYNSLQDSLQMCLADLHAAELDIRQKVEDLIYTVQRLQERVDLLEDKQP